MMMSSRMVFVVALAGLSVSGCQTINSVTGMGGDAPAAPAPAPAVVQADAAPIPPAAQVAQGPASLKGMDSTAVMALWGEPALRRKDIGSELWTYNKGGAKCSVLLYLYPSSNGRMTVKRSEAVPGGSEDSVVDACARANNLSGVKPIS